MRSSDNDYPFGPNFNFGVENLMNAKNNEQGPPYPPVEGTMLLLDDTHMLLLDGTDMLLL